VTWGGEFENQQRAMKRLAMVVPVSIFLIFVLLFDAFKSVKSAALILLNVPFALIGGILALLLTGIPLSVSAAIGFIALFGQAVLNGVVMVSYFNQLREKRCDRPPSVRHGAPLRLRTVLMTAILAMLGCYHMAMSHWHRRGNATSTCRGCDRPGLYRRPCWTLFNSPLLYPWFEKFE
jgi:cobalt-zinc-cadmium resistance protein CzcA